MWEGRKTVKAPDASPRGVAEDRRRFLQPAPYASTSPGEMSKDALIAQAENYSLVNEYLVQKEEEGCRAASRQL